jgi:hypothetical protein
MQRRCRGCRGGWRCVHTANCGGCCEMGALTAGTARARPTSAMRPYSCSASAAGRCSGGAWSSCAGAGPRRGGRCGAVVAVVSCAAGRRGRCGRRCGVVVCGRRGTTSRAGDVARPSDQGAGGAGRGTWSEVVAPLRRCLVTIALLRRWRLIAPSRRCVMEAVGRVLVSSERGCTA